MRSWLTVVSLFLAQVCLADSSTAVSWDNGPARLPLGDYAQVDVPAGYKFADAENARIFLHLPKNAKSDGKLLGLMMPTSGDWQLRFEYFDTGHINDALPAPLDAPAILSALQPRIQELNKARESLGQPAMAKVDWDTKPVYHPDTHALEWSLHGVGISGESVLDYNFQMLGRQGVLQARATLFRASIYASEALHDLVSLVSFKPGKRYSDFSSGDKPATLNLAGVVTTQFSNHRHAADASSGAETVGGMKAFWISFAVLGCVGIVGGGLLAKKLRQHKASGQSSAAQAPLAPFAAPMKADVKVNGTKPFNKPFKFAARQKAARSGANGNGASSNGQGKRKRMFNYHKFYTEMVLQGPAPVIDNYAYDPEALRYGNQNHGSGNGHSNSNGHNNGSSNGHSNGNGHGGEVSPAAVLSAHSELIASQKSLIEEQKRLIHEQARLIEEKSRLIAEKRHLLDTQAQMIDNNLV